MRREWSGFLLCFLYMPFLMGSAPHPQYLQRQNGLHIQGSSEIFLSSQMYSRGVMSANVDQDFGSFEVEASQPTLHQMTSVALSRFWKRARRMFVATALIPVVLGAGIIHSRADDELAKFAAAGNTVGVDGKCFLTQCSSETADCANDRTCLKGLSCLARCKGGSMCSTGCFAKFGSSHLDELLHCSVEKHDCVHVPGKENVGWNTDTLADLPSKPLTTFNPASMQGVWFKTMGLDSRYDCFDCQRNSFILKDQGTLSMEAEFRIPRPNFPGYLQSKIEEELHLTDPQDINQYASMQSEGKMFGLTFWENWYVLGDTKAIKSLPQTGLITSAYASETFRAKPDFKLIFYTGHTLQGSYKGAFLYSRTPSLSTSDMDAAKKFISSAGLEPSKFCVIRNQCFLKDKDVKTSRSRQQEMETAKGQSSPLSLLSSSLTKVTEVIAGELADWFDDPTILSEWLVSQQVKVTPDQSIVRGPR